MKPPILVAMPISAALRDRLAAHYTLFGPIGRATPHVLPDGAEVARAFVTLGGFPTNGALMDKLPALGLIACYGTGFEGVDRAEAIKRGIQLTHAGDTNATAVAEFAMGLIITTGRNLMRGDRMVRSGQWATLSIARGPLAPGLAGSRVGIFGMGAIGVKIAQRAAAFDMAVGYCNRSRRTDVDYAYFDGLPALAAWCDILVVAVRAGPETRHAVNAEILQALGPQGILINIARGLVVDEAALCTALEDGVIRGAGLDVYEDEPHVPERLRALDNTVLTPHVAALSTSAQLAQQDLLVENLAAFFAGKPLRAKMPLP
jgi:hydroxypyruvate reductase